MAYNPYEQVKDGPIWASRLWHHRIKILTGMTVYAGLSTLFRVFEWNTIWLIFVGIGIEIFVQIKEAIRPTDPAVRPWSQRLPDWATDCALYSMAGVLELVARREWIFSLMYWSVLYLAYRANRHLSRP